MIEVGVKELKNELSRYLKRVADGEQVRVTSRGRAIADLVPAGTRRKPDRLEQLIAEGRVTPGRRPLPKSPPPPAPGKGSATEVILAEREEER